jgi:hypothetical protein
MADEPKLCTTNGKSVAEVRASQTNETGQHEGYIVLCDEERAKGFVRPYRDSYKHVGRVQEEPAKPENCPSCHAGAAVIRTSNIDPLKWLCLDCAHVWKCAAQGSRVGGCGTVTTMGRALSETYARDPKFYGATFCVACNRHLPVSEFVWTADGAIVGS